MFCRSRVAADGRGNRVFCATVRALFAIPLALGACSSLEVHGGRTVRAGDEPQGTSLGAWVTAGCRDAAGDGVTQSSRVFLVRRPDGQTVLVEARPAYDSIVVDNSYVDGRQIVFQVAFDESGPLALREVRLPADAKGPGQLVVARAFTEPDPVRGRFRAVVRQPAFSCRLEPLAPPPPASREFANDAGEGGEAAPPDAAPPDAGSD